CGEKAGIEEREGNEPPPAHRRVAAILLHHLGQFGRAKRDQPVTKRGEVRRPARRTGRLCARLHALAEGPQVYVDRMLRIRRIRMVEAPEIPLGRARSYGDTA